MRSKIWKKRQGKTVSAQNGIIGDCSLNFWPQEPVNQDQTIQSHGLTKMTVSNIISEFMEKGIVVEDAEENTQTCGRNPML